MSYGTTIGSDCRRTFPCVTGLWKLRANPAHSQTKNTQYGAVEDGTHLFRVTARHFAWRSLALELSHCSLPLQVVTGSLQHLRSGEKGKGALTRRRAVCAVSCTAQATAA